MPRLLIDAPSEIHEEMDDENLETIKDKKEFFKTRRKGRNSRSPISKKVIETKVVEDSDNDSLADLFFS